MARFTLPRDVYHGKGCLSELKNLKGKKAVLVIAADYRTFRDSWTKQ